MSKPCNGYPSWNQWNVSLWINNDESLYRLALYCIENTKTRGAAAKMFMCEIGEGSRTPDGGKYNLTAIRNAMRDM